MNYNIVQEGKGLISDFSSADIQVRRSAARKLKNALIGSCERKSIFLSLGIVHVLCRTLTEEVDDSVIADVTTAIGSLAHGDIDHVQAVCTTDVVVQVLRQLRSSDMHVLSSCARTLKTIWQAAPLEHLTAAVGEVVTNDVIEQLVKLLRLSSIGIVLPVVAVLGQCCSSEERRACADNVGGINALLQLLQRADHASELYRTVLSTLEAWTHDSHLMCAKVAAAIKPTTDDARTTSTSTLDFVGDMVTLIRHGGTPIRLVAANCLTNLHREKAIALPDTTTTMLLTMLVKLLREGHVEYLSSTLLALARLIDGEERLQLQTSSAEVIPLLLKMLGAPPAPPLTAPTTTRRWAGLASPARTHEAALLAVAAVCSKNAVARNEVVAPTSWGRIVAALRSENLGTRRAATRCILSISRSVRTLRTALVDKHLAQKLCIMLDDDDYEVRCTTAAAICNVVMEFSPVKKTAMDIGVVDKLVQGTHDSHGEFRLNCIWALKNLLFEADSPTASVTKSRVMAVLTWPHLLALVADVLPTVQEQALGTLRNLVFGSRTDVANVITGCGGEDSFFALLETHLLHDNAKCQEQTLYIICNATADATSTAELKDTIMARPELLALIFACLAPTVVARVKVAALWCIINLAWAASPGAEKRQRALLQLDVLGALQALHRDTDLDVKDRAKSTLEQFTAFDFDGLVPMEL
eukprot:m.254584 g.254584  ORF g.254584 m.254584 type:complete len:697 (+) comp19604_c0_seq2:242-2332(+)